MLGNIKNSIKNLTTIRGIVLSGLLIALYVVLGYFKIYITPTNRISFTFIATAVSGIVLGPVPAMLTGILGDIVNYLLAPSGGAYFPGYAITYALTGFVYGIFLYRQPFKHSLVCIIFAQLIISALLNIGLNTFWSSILYKKAMLPLLGGSIIKNIALYPVHVIIIFALTQLFEKTGLKKKYKL